MISGAHTLLKFAHFKEIQNYQLIVTTNKEMDRGSLCKHECVFLPLSVADCCIAVVMLLRPLFSVAPVQRSG